MKKEHLFGLLLFFMVANATATEMNLDTDPVITITQAGNGKFAWNASHGVVDLDYTRPATGYSVGCFDLTQTFVGGDVGMEAAFETTPNSTANTANAYGFSATKNPVVGDGDMSLYLMGLRMDAGVFLYIVGDDGSEANSSSMGAFTVDDTYTIRFSYVSPTNLRISAYNQNTSTALYNQSIAIANHNNLTYSYFCSGNNFLSSGTGTYKATLDNLFFSGQVSGFNTTTAFNATSIELSPQDFTMTLIMSEGSLAENLPTVNLYYNNTFYNTTETNLSATSSSYFSTLTTPDVAAATSVPLLWEIIWSNQTTNITNTNTSQETQSVSPFLFDNCTTATSETINFTIRNEANLSIITGTSFSAWDYIFQTQSKNYSTQQTPDHLFCMDPSDVSLEINMSMEYESTGFSQRTHFLRDLTLTNTTQNFDIYLLNTTDSKVFVATIRDSGYDPAPNALIQARRFYPDENIYRTVEIAETDSDGVALLHLDGSGDVIYRYIIEDENGDVVFTSADTRPFCETSSCELFFYTQEDKTNPFEPFENITGLSYSLTYANLTKLFTYTWTDTTGDVTNARLLVTNMSSTSSNVVCDVNTSAASGTLTCNLTTSGFGDFRADAFVSNPSETLVTRILVSVVDYFETFGDEGVFLTALLVLSLFMIGVWIGNIPAGLLFGVFGLWGGHLIGFIGIGITSIASVAFLAILIITKMVSK